MWTAKDLTINFQRRSENMKIKWTDIQVVALDRSPWRKTAVQYAFEREKD